MNHQTKEVLHTYRHLLEENLGILEALAAALTKLHTLKGEN